MLKRLFVVKQPEIGGLIREFRLLTGYTHSLQPRTGFLGDELRKHSSQYLIKGNEHKNILLFRAFKVNTTNSIIGTLIKRGQL